MANSTNQLSLLKVFLLLGIGLFFALDSIQALPQSRTNSHGDSDSSKCKTIDVRKEWRKLPDEDRLDYIRAVKCLMGKPSSSTRVGVRSRFDEFQSSHIDLSPQIHRTGQFLPWHRHFVTLFFNALRDECAYKGPGVYWDWTIDSDGPGLIKDSPVFDPKTGFGGGGAPGTYTLPSDATPNPYPGVAGCVATGPFSTKKVLNLGVGPTAIGERCLVRLIGEGYRNGTTSEIVRRTMSRTPFEEFRKTLELGDEDTGIGFHTSGHGLVGGDMWDLFSSPGEPLFYLHHANVDRIWAKWQREDAVARLYDISGSAEQNPTAASRNVTLDFKMPFTTLSRPVKIKEVMDIEQFPSCYCYED